MLPWKHNHMRGDGKMRRLGGIGGRKRGGRGSVAFALALALFLGAPAIADKVPAGYAQWDYWGRSRPLPVYVPVWSADNGVCKRIVRALNGAGPSPASLYGDPIFLRWRDDPDWLTHEMLLSDFGKWMEVPFFNDGKPAIAFKVTSPATYFVQETLYVFDNPRYYRARTWIREAGLRDDPHALRPLEPFLSKRFDSFMAFPKTMKDYRYWSPMWLGDNSEINIAELRGKIYSVIRMPALEFTLVLSFTEDREGHAVCLIGPNKLVR